MVFFNSQLKADLYKPSKKANVNKGLKKAIVTVTHPISTDISDTVVTTTDGDNVWIDAMPWCGAMLTKGVNKDIDGIPVEPFVNNSVNKPKDRKTYMKEYMAKRRSEKQGGYEQVSDSESV